MTICNAVIKRSSRQGMSLVEMMVAVAAGSLVLAAAATMWIFTARSFASTGNYMDMDTKSRQAVDLMLRDIRQATSIVGFQNTGSNNWLTVTNSLAAGTGATFAWNSDSRSLVCRKSGQPDKVYLTECDLWAFSLYQRTPHTNGTYVFFPATNVSGTIDLSITKLVNMTWKCSRKIIGKTLNTENVQTAQVVLRNKQ